MATLASLAVVRHGVTVIYNNEPTKIGYNPEVLTQQWIERLEAFQKRASEDESMTEDEARNGIAAFILELLTDWDVTEDAAGKIPAELSVSNVRRTSIAFQRALLMQVIQDYASKNRQGTARAKSRKPSRRSS